MRTTLLTGFLAASTIISTAEEWAGWRGAGGLGVSAEKNLPIHWGPETNVLWMAPIPGRGASSPITFGNRVFLTTQTDDSGLHVLAIDRVSGKILWDKELARGSVNANKLHNMATPSVAADARHLWAMFGTGEIACLDHDGQIVWQRNLFKEYGANKTNHGYGSSPMLHDGKIFVVCMHQAASWVLALDAVSGRNVWKKDRNLEPKDEAQDSYSSPIFLPVAGRTQMILEGAEVVNAYDPATGEELWSRGGMKVPHPYGRTIAGVAGGEGKVIAVASGFQNRGFTMALNPNGKGPLDDAHQLWKVDKFSADCPTPVVYQGNVYMIRDDGMASCVDLKTGEPRWQERLFTANVKVSPVAADGKIYFLSGQGNCYVVKAGSKFELLATNEFKEATLSTPAISGGHLFIRTDRGLYCVGR